MRFYIVTLGGLLPPHAVPMPAHAELAHDLADVVARYRTGSVGVSAPASEEDWSLVAACILHRRMPLDLARRVCGVAWAEVRQALVNRGYDAAAIDLWQARNVPVGAGDGDSQPAPAASGPKRMSPDHLAELVELARGGCRDAAELEDVRKTLAGCYDVDFEAVRADIAKQVAKRVVGR